jgi:TRAP-type C4-dicarboxylate transport system permease large subunit
MAQFPSHFDRFTVPEMLRQGYSPRLAAGTLASASTLDILIPPSIPMVIYATMTETSIGRMRAGGIVPGVILSVMFIIAIRIAELLGQFWRRSQHFHVGA